MRLPLVFVLLATAACAMPASAAVRTFPLGGFDRINNSTPFDVRVHTGTAPGARAEGPQEALDRLDVSVRGGELVISSRPGGGWFSGWHMHGQRMVINVGVAMLQAATLNGPGDLTVDRIRAPRFAVTLSGPGDVTVGALETEQFNLTLNGPGDVTVAGRAATSDIALHGPGDVHAAGLTSRNAVVLLSGPGDITTTVTGTVQGTLAGPGDITIHGGARCDISKHGPGDVHCG